MEDLEKTHRLQEIQAKLDPRAETRVRDGGLFKAGELLRRKLVHEGTLLWKTPGSRLKGTQNHNTQRCCFVLKFYTDSICNMQDFMDAGQGNHLPLGAFVIILIQLFRQSLLALERPPQS